jgi:hypothetical protein
MLGFQIKEFELFLHKNYFFQVIHSDGYNFLFCFNGIFNDALSFQNQIEAICR